MSEKKVDPIDKILALRTELNDILIEREEETNGLLVAMIAGQHILLIAPKGTAKSMQVEKLAKAIMGARYFRRLLTKHTAPDEIFGAVKFSKLKEDIYERNLAKKLPEAHFAFLDEIFKCNSSVLNSLLTILNEREYDNNGDTIHVPLITMVGCSNEFPEGDELSALYDRLLIRYIPKYIQEDSGFAKLLTMTDRDPATQITLEEVEELKERAKKVTMDADMVKMMVKLRKELGKEGIVISDRRWRQSLSCIRAQAIINGRTTIAPDDLRILHHIFWDRQDDISKVENIIMENVNPYGKEMNDIMQAMGEALKGLNGIDPSSGERVLQAAETTSKIKKAVKRLDEIKEKMREQGRDVSIIESEIVKAKEKMNRIIKENLEL